MASRPPSDALTREVLSALSLDMRNPGASTGAAWLPGEYTFASINPATGEPIAHVDACTRANYETVMAAAERAWQSWRIVPPPKRGEVIRRIGEALRARKSMLGTLITLETGKIKAEGDGEVQEMIDIADFAVGQSRMLYGKTMHSERPQHRMYEQWHPLGVVGVISAFNFPAAVWSWNAFVAAVAGDVVVWKPSTKAPLTAIAIQHIVNAVLHDMGHDGVFTMVASDDNALTEDLVVDRRIPLVSFTGSSVVGKRLSTLVAQRMARSLLECSGNNAVIVDETADLDLAVRAIVFGAVGTAGQRCTTTRRLIAQADIYDVLVDRLARAYEAVRIGDPLDPSTLMGPLIDGAAVERFRDTMHELAASGARIAYGGNALSGPGFFVQPTLVHADAQCPAVQRETFAPILYAMRYRTLDEAIALNNAVPQGLSSSIFTRDLQHAEAFLSARGSDCGIANVNVGTSGAEIGGAFGGEKETGGGREAGSDAWQAYMRRQTNTINWGTDLPLAQGIQFNAGE